jgi:hypothetical protein
MMDLAVSQMTVARDLLLAATRTTSIIRPWHRRLIDALVPGRRGAIRRFEEMIELARQNPPPQRWYDEDFTACDRTLRHQ